MNLHRTFLWQVILLLACGVWAAAQTTNLLSNGSFESGKPSLWTAEPGASGATLTWASDQMHQGTRSLKIEKAGTAASARWKSSNNVRYWVEKVDKGVDIKVGAWVKTQGVNTSPATDAAKWQIKFWFYDTLGALISGVPFALDVDQSVATKDWYADTNGVGTVNLPVDAYKVEISAEAGQNATGTVWFDDFVFVGRGAWAGQNWNGFVDADSGWQYWIAPDGGNDGRTYFPASGVTTEQARTGSSSLKIAASSGRNSGELVWFSETVPVTANKTYVLSAWVRTSDIPADSVFNAESQLGFTVTWHSKLFADGGGWNEVAGADYRFTLKDTSTGWTQYAAVFTAPGTANAVSVRARSWHLWYGTSYWDDIDLQETVVSGATGVREEPRLTDGAVPTDYALLQNYPNPFNPTTSISFQLPQAGHVRLEVFNVLGQKVATLVDDIRSAGTWTAHWNGRTEAGASLATGLYIYRLSTPELSMTKKMVMMK